MNSLWQPGNNIHIGHSSKYQKNVTIKISLSWESETQSSVRSTYGLILAMHSANHGFTQCLSLNEDCDLWIVSFSQKSKKMFRNFICKSKGEQQEEPLGLEN